VDVRRNIFREQLDVHLWQWLPGGAHRANARTRPGCCSYGAHFTDEKDQRRVEKAALRLTADQWQFKSRGKNGTTRVKKNGDIMTRLVQDAASSLTDQTSRADPDARCT